MATEHNLIKTIELENKLTLNLYDESVKMVGDRWLVTLVARINIAVDDVPIQDQRFSLPVKGDIKKLLGENVVFEQKHNRIFIDASDKQSVLEEMSASFIENTLPYLSHNDFAVRYVARRVRQEMDKQRYAR